MKSVFVILSVLASSAFAEEAKVPGGKLVDYVNCDALSGTSKICVFNHTRRSIKSIGCAGSWGTTDIPLARGSIPSGKMSIVDFNSGRCKKDIVITTAEGQKHEIKGQDISSLTVLPVTETDSNW